MRHPDIYNAIFAYGFKNIGWIPEKPIPVNPKIYKQVEDAFHEDSGKQRVHVLPQYAEELAKNGCPKGLDDSLRLHTDPHGGGKYKPGSKSDLIPEMERHPSISPERTWARGKAFLASAGRLVIGPTTYFFAKKDGKETTCEPKKLTTITACAPNLSGRSDEDMAKFTVGTGKDCKFTENGLELYKAHCQMLADFIVSSAKDDGKSELIMPDFGLGLYINALNTEGKNQAREAMLTAFSEASQKYDIKINWILYAQDPKSPSPAAVDQKKMYDAFLAKQAGGARISVKLGDIFHEIHEASANAAVLNPGSERTLGGDYANTGAMSLEEIIADSSTLLGVSAALGGANLPVFVSQGDGTYSDMGVTVATFDKVVNECVDLMKRELLISALNDFYESYLEERKSSGENELITQIEEINEDTPIEEIQTLAEAVTGYIQGREIENTETSPLLEKFYQALNFGASAASGSAAAAAVTAPAPRGTEEGSAPDEIRKFLEALRFVVGNIVPGGRPYDQVREGDGELKIVFLKKGNTELVPAIKTCLGELGITVEQSALGGERGRAALQVSPGACHQIIKVAERKEQVIKVLNDFKTKYSDKLPSKKQGFFASLVGSHGEGKALIKRIDKLDEKPFSEIQTLAQEVAKHIEERQGKKSITSDKAFEPILSNLNKVLHGEKPADSTPSPRR